VGAREDKLPYGGCDCGCRILAIPQGTPSTTDAGAV
jgi:hypothetical protein